MPPHPPTHHQKEMASRMGGSGDEPTVGDRLRELERRHATGVDDDRSANTGGRAPARLERGVRGDADEVSRSDSEEEADRGVEIDEEEELWRRVARDGF